MLQWKERLYAFLLRRVLLGPYLTPESLAQLHACLDVSLQDGTYVLHQVDCCADYLTARYQTLALHGLRVRSARVRKLTIHLSLQEHDRNGAAREVDSSPSAAASDGNRYNTSSSNPPSSSSSLAWRAMQLGNESAAVSLVVRIELEGVELCVEACPKQQAAVPPAEQQQPEQPQNDTKSYLSSYMDAALSSLRLSVQLKELRIRVYSSHSRNSSRNELSDDDWLELRAQSVSYRDVLMGPQPEAAGEGGGGATTTMAPTGTTTATTAFVGEPQQQDYRTALHKVIEWTRLTVLTGGSINDSSSSSNNNSSSTDVNVQTVALLEGTSRATLRVIEYGSSDSQDESSSRSQQQEQLAVRTQNDILVSMLDQKLNVSVDTTSLGCIRRIAHSFRRQRQKQEQPNDDGADAAAERIQPSTPTAQLPDFSNNNNDDEADYRTIDGIMKQYQEARRMAERNLFRGGMLVPSFGDDDDSLPNAAGGGTSTTNEVTFDAFFDANEHSFSRYSTVLKESMLAGGDASASALLGRLPADWVHTKFRFDLREGGIKVAFRSSTSTSSNAERPPPGRSEEYVLLTFSEVSLASTLTAKSSEHSFSINHLELEDSLLASSSGDETDSTFVRNVEIGSLVRFVPKDGGDDGSDCDLLVEAPCISLHVKAVKGDDEKNATDVELILEPIECSYRQQTISKLSKLLSQTFGNNTQVTDAVEASADAAADVSHPKSLTLFVSCASIDVALPLSVEQEDWSRLYERCGYVADGDLARKSALGIVFHQVVLEVQLDSTTTRKSNDLSVSCHNTVVYACSPKSQTVFDRTVHRFDIFALCGRNEVDPCIPIAVKISQLAEANKGDLEGVAILSFPKAPTISSFKTREEDEDDDDRIDQVLSSKLHDINVNSRKELRGADPQSTMLSDVAMSDVVVAIHVPEIVGDLSMTELSVLKSMIDTLSSISAESSVPNRAGASTESENDVPSKRVALSLVLGFASLAVHRDTGEFDVPDHRGSKELHSYSYMAKLDVFKVHVLVDGSNLRHARAMCQEFDFFEISDLYQTLSFQDVSGLLEPRISFLRERGMCHEDSVATPILYRSHLFSPISRSSPALLFDVLNVATEDAMLVQRNVYLTVYDTTYRYDYDSRWIHRLSSLLPQPKAAETEEQEQEGSESDHAQSLTRAFFSIADCNVDYSSSQRFRTASRTILRVGDFRASSNIMSPRTTVQAYSVSLGDVALYLCNSRYPYNFENGRLLRADTVMHPYQYQLSALKLPKDADSEAVQGAMNYRTLVTVDSLDAIIATSSRKSRAPSDPSVCASFTVGQVSLFVCKDSFRCFTKTIGEAAAEATALSEEALNALRVKSTEKEKTEAPLNEEEKDDEPRDVLADLQQQSIIRPAFGTSLTDGMQPNFLLDGYDWTTIDSDLQNRVRIPEGEDHAARWYTDEEVGISPSQQHEDDSMKEASSSSTGPRIISDHFQLRPMSDPIGDGDMGIEKLIGPGVRSQVQTRVLVHDLSLRLRLFDGYDWPGQLGKEEREVSRGDAFLIPEVPSNSAKEATEKTESGDAFVGTSASESSPEYGGSTAAGDRKSKLMGDLLSGGGLEHDNSTFRDLPLPEERGRSLKEQAELRRLARRTGKYIHIAASGVSVRLDTLEESKEHRLASCLNVMAQDFFLAESISSKRPVKMIGEWLNEQEHPRDSKDGLIMMKMVTRHPACRVTANNEIVNDESQVLLQLLPLRCLIDQRAVAFVRAFFHSVDDADAENDVLSALGLYAVPPPLFTTFKLRPLKLKVDYQPQKLDSRALRDGSVVELVNLSPIDGMVLTLQQVHVSNEVGFGSALSLVVTQWVRYICATQLYKFVTNTRPLEPITAIGGGAVDMVVLPWEAFRNGESMQKAFRSGAKSFSKALAYEFLTLTSRAAEFVAGQVSRASLWEESPGAGAAAAAAAAAGGGGGGRLTAGGASAATTSGGDWLPSRPRTIPRGVLDATPHAVESLSRGLQAANYKIVIVPFLEYQRTGGRAKGAVVTKVLKGIPVAIAAPASGAAEALSFALLGARNQIRPELRKEEEAMSLRGLWLQQQPPLDDDD